MSDAVRPASAATLDHVRFDVREDIAFVTLDAPPLNIMTGALMDELTRALGRASADRSLKGIALVADGKAFSAGADVGEHAPEHAPDMIRAFSRLFDAMAAVELPIVAAVDGAALGAGFELVTMADIVVATERAKFGQPEIRLGFFAPLGVSWLADRVGFARATEITATGRTYSAAEMHAMGFVARLASAGTLDDALAEVLADLRKASPLVMRLNMRMLRRARQARFGSTRRDAERVFLEELMATEDVREGIASFTEKRTPRWTNR